MENGQVKPGWKTSEFWLTVASQLPGILTMVLGASNPWALGIGAAVTLGYNLARAWHKNAAVTALAGLQAAAEASSKIAQEPAKP